MLFPHLLEVIIFKQCFPVVFFLLIVFFTVDRRGKILLLYKVNVVFHQIIGSHVDNVRSNNALQATNILHEAPKKSNLLEL